MAPGEKQLKVLHLLQTDNRMPAVWESFGNNSKYALATIMNCFQRAGLVSQKSGMLKQISKDFSALKEAEKLLREHFSCFLPVEGMNAPNHIVERGEKMLELQVALNYARDFLHEQELEYRRNISRFSPASRNTGEPVNAFTTMLCNEFESNIGQPHYDRVAMIAEVVYQLTDEPTVEAVRMRHVRDRQARASEGLRPWHAQYDDDSEMPTND